MTLAAACAVYSFATPGVNAPNVGVPESVSASVAGTVPDTSPVTVELARNVVGVMVGLPGVFSHWVKYVSSLVRFEDSKPAFCWAICFASAMNASVVIVEPLNWSISARWKSQNAASPTSWR